MKKCLTCLELKSYSFFNKDRSRKDGHRERCSNCMNTFRRDNKLNYSPSKIKWNQINKDKCKEYKRIGYERIRINNNIARNNKLPECPILKKEARLARNRYQEWWKRILNIEYNIKKNLRIRLNKALKGSFKSSSAWESAGCSMDFLKNHLSGYLPESIVWTDYSNHWEIDHIIPLSFFDLTKDSNIKIACHYSNLRALPRTENMKKGSKIQDVSALLCVNAKLVGTF